jgi:hypothetical protein
MGESIRSHESAVLNSMVIAIPVAPGYVNSEQSYPLEHSSYGRYYRNAYCTISR